MKSNAIFWKCVSANGAKKILRALRDRYLCIKLAERRNGKLKILKEFNEGMQYMEIEGVEKQIKFITSNPIEEMNQFYIIRTT